MIGGGGRSRRGNTAGVPLMSELSLLVLSFLYGFVSYERNVGALDFSLLGVLITTATT